MNVKTISVKKALALLLSLLMLLSLLPAASLPAFAAGVVVPEPSEEDLSAAAAVEVLIDAIGTVVYTPACAEKIEAARAAYDALTSAQKKLVENVATLQEAEVSYGLLAAAAQLEATNRAAAGAVDQLIAAIGTVTYTDDSRGKIAKARFAYDSLTDAQKRLVTKYAQLEAAEARYAELAAAAAAAQYAADDVCPWDNEIHGKDFGGMLLHVIHSFLYFFAHLFGTR